MDTDTIGAALRRKVGPLPVWIWSIIGGIGVYFLRKRGYFGGMGAAQSGETFQPSQANATPPQAQVPLQPGESVYDPNTGALSTAPGGDTGMDNGGATGVDPSQAMDDLANAIAAGFTTHVSVDQTKPKRAKKSAAKHDKKPSHLSKRTARKKAGHHQQPGHKGTAKNPPHKGRARSNATKRLVNGGRTAVNAGKRITGMKGRHSSPSNVPHPRQGANATYTHQANPRTVRSVAKPTTRQRPTVGLTRQTAPVAHPVSSHTPSPHKAAAARTPAPPRPSAPAPRAVRPAPAPPPARKVSPPRAKRRSR